MIPEIPNGGDLLTTVAVSLVILVAFAIIWIGVRRIRSDDPFR
ncbi:hypothetical protein ACFQE1_07985 [Halobium palmae]|uniref:LPXTG cell wall anchor domain-containing protein n=1 Tax=Halobium palmae TaxID=1776492 RepID=A0ABD5S080_9EURY